MKMNRIALGLIAALLMSGPAVAQETAPTPSVETAPRQASAGDLTVRDATMMGWNVVGEGLGGEVAFTVRNAGPTPDRIVSVETPAGPVGTLAIQVARNGEAVSLPAGETAVAAKDPADTHPAAGFSRVTVQLTDLTSGRPASERTTVTVVFESAGALTVVATPVSPAPPPAR